MTIKLPAVLDDYQDLPEPETKAELMERMAVAADAADLLIESYDEAALTRPLGESGWSAKDYLAHLTDWERSIVVLLQKKDRFEAMGLPKELVAAGDYDAENDILYERHKNRPLEDVVSDFRRNHQELVDIVEGLGFEELQKPYIYYQPNAREVVDGDYVNNPVIGWLVGDTYTHYAEHLVYLAEELG